MPLLNTFILVCSSITVTAAHKSLVKGDYSSFFVELLFTIILGFIFEILQILEYISAPFNISDGIYGSTFYLLTGLHGLHVLIGALFLLVAFIRGIKGHLLRDQHIGFLLAI
jgi:cytochrome c oxidase subunit 3